MVQDLTPIFVPGLICSADLFAAQLSGLDHPVAPRVANTLGHDSLADMASEALESVTGMVVPIGLSMGGYVALEMVRQAPERVAGIGLLNTAYGTDNDERRAQREATIKMAQSDSFLGVTRHLLKSFLSPAAMQDEDLVARVTPWPSRWGRRISCSSSRPSWGAEVRLIRFAALRCRRWCCAAASTR